MLFRNRRRRLEVSASEEFLESVRNILADLERQSVLGVSPENVDVFRNTISQVRLNCRRMSTELGEDRYQELENVFEAIEVHLQDVSNTALTSGHDTLRDTRFVIRGGVGGPRLDKDTTQLQHLLNTGFSVTRIARDGLLGMRMHRNTVRNIMTRNDIQPPRQQYGCDDELLKEIVADYIHEHPNSGSEERRAYLRTRQLPVVVSRERVRKVVTEIDPVGVATRLAHVVRRRQYSVPGPNSLWHIDSHHSLVRYGIYIHGCVDGDSRLVTYLKAASYNTAKTALEAFVTGVKAYGVPSRIRIDAGVENGLLKKFMDEANGNNRGSWIEGRSVHNQRIERLWRDVFQKVVYVYYQALHALEESEALDINNQLHMFSAQAVFMPRLNNALEIWRVSRNSQPLRIEKNMTPDQLWMSRLAAQRHSTSTAVRKLIEGPDIDFIVERAAPGTVLDGKPFQPRPVVVLPQEAIEGLSQFDMLKSVADFGIHLYGDVLEYVTSVAL